MFRFVGEYLSVEVYEGRYPCCVCIMIDKSMRILGWFMCVGYQIKYNIEIYAVEVLILYLNTSCNIQNTLSYSYVT